MQRLAQVKLAGARRRENDDRQHRDDQKHHVFGCKGHQPGTIGAQKRRNDNDAGHAYPVIDAELIVQQGSDDVQGTAHGGQQYDDE